MYRVAFVVLHLGQQRLEAVVERVDDEGERHRRAVDVVWFTKEPTDVPPTDWRQQVGAELDLQDTDRMPRIPR